MLEIEALHVSHGPVEAVRGVSLRVAEQEVVAIVGANGAGKTSLLSAIFGTVTASGSARWHGRELLGLAAAKIARLGVAMAPEGRLLAPSLSIGDNLLAGGYVLGGMAEARRRLDELLPQFPLLAGRLEQAAAVLSGGERQVLAIARSLMARPRLLLLDEPMLGLSAGARGEVAGLLRGVRAQGCTLLLADQQAQAVAGLADRVLHMERGRLPGDDATGGGC